MKTFLCTLTSLALLVPSEALFFGNSGANCACPSAPVCPPQPVCAPAPPPAPCPPPPPCNGVANGFAATNIAGYNGGAYAAPQNFNLQPNLLPANGAQLPSFGYQVAPSANIFQQNQQLFPGFQQPFQMPNIHMPNFNSYETSNIVGNILRPAGSYQKPTISIHMPEFLNAANAEALPLPPPPQQLQSPQPVAAPLPQSIEVVKEVTVKETEPSYEQTPNSQPLPQRVEEPVAIPHRHESIPATSARSQKAKEEAPKEEKIERPTQPEPEETQSVEDPKIVTADEPVKAAVTAESEQLVQEDQLEKGDSIDTVYDDIAEAVDGEKSNETTVKTEVTPSESASETTPAPLESSSSAYKSVARARGSATFVPDSKCNSDQMRKVIHENIHENVSIAKRQIQKLLTAAVGGSIDVICANGTFSYIVNTELFCEVEKDGVTCLAFRQAA